MCSWKMSVWLLMNNNDVNDLPNLDSFGKLFRGT